MFGKNRNKKVLMVVTACLVLAGIWAVLAKPETALAKKPGGGGGGKKQEIPVSVTFRDLAEDGIQSDGSTYEKNGREKVKVFIGMGGQLRMMLWDSNVRSIRLNIPDSDCSDPPEGGLVHANLLTLGEDDDGNGILTEDQLDPGGRGDRLNLLAMELGSDTRAGLRIHFPDDNGDGSWWYVLFGGGDADLVTVTRESASVWIIEAGVGDLAALVRSGQGQELCAVVSMPFQITVEILP